MCAVDWTDPFAVAEVLIENALIEDEALNDAASGALAEFGDLPVTCFVNPREEIVVAGIDLAALVFSILPGEVRVEIFVEEGRSICAGERMAGIHGPAACVLRGERIFLNILCRLCGIATATFEFVSVCNGIDVEILDTRKTTPGMRALEKYAVRMGGGVNHRFSLADMAMLKDNHLAAIGGVGNLLPVIGRLRNLDVPIEVEVDSLQQLRAVTSLLPDRILLDNMSPNELREAVALAGNSGIYLEASGGITLETVRDVAETGVNGISVGMLTHSVRSSDIGLDWFYDFDKEPL
ncbi:MAG: carboxylating nicotinate-nucleotide diphosphorylase [Candidatus Sabulitectum sp.]|nr:carboxylating nicotinate-nucleotide diphosphorylase [Candidatus Sabulitectum sp.]